MEPMRGRTWRRVTEFGIYIMRDHEADVPLIDLSPESDQRPGHICHPHTDTDRGREREADMGGGRWKGCRHARTLKRCEQDGA